MDCNTSFLNANIASYNDNDARLVRSGDDLKFCCPSHRCHRRRRRQRRSELNTSQQPSHFNDELVRAQRDDGSNQTSKLCRWEQQRQQPNLFSPQPETSQSSRCHSRLTHSQSRKSRPQLSRSSPIILSFNFVFLCYILLPAIVLLQMLFVRPTESSEFPTNIASPQTKNSGQFTISQLCAGKPQFPITKRVEGAVLTSKDDVDVNCTVTFRTRTEKQIFVFHFEELKLGCDEHLKIFDGDLDYANAVIKDFSCKDNLAKTPIMKTTGTFLTMRFSSDSRTKSDDGFRLIITAVFDGYHWDCPVDYSLCSNKLCISRALFCDGINHCLDNSDESGCSSSTKLGGLANGGGSSFLSGELTLTNALGLLVVLVLIIFTCVIIFISAIYCRRESHYAQYQHHLQRAIGVPLQTSSSLMFTNHQQQPQYHYFQPANLSPYITPTHNAALVSTTLPRGYSTLPLNLAGGRQAAQIQQQLQQQQFQQLQQQHQQHQHQLQQQFHHQQHQHQQQRSPSIGPTKANNIAGGAHNANQEYLMMAGLTGPPTAAMQSAPTMQTNLFLPTSQSILTGTSVRYQPPQQQQQQQQQPQDPRR